TSRPIMWKSSAFAIRALRSLYEQRTSPAPRHTASGRVIGGIALGLAPEVKPSPGLLGAASLITRVGCRMVRNPIRLRTQNNEWLIAVRPKLGSRTVFDDRSGFKAYQNPPGRFYADPILFSHAGQRYLFVEDCPLGQLRGELTCLRVQPDG